MKLFARLAVLFTTVALVTMAIPSVARAQHYNQTNLVADDVIERVYQDPAPAAAGRRGEALTDCIDKLEGRAAQAVKGHYFDGVKLNELADRMGMTSVAMRQLLHRVRVLLLECVRRRLSVENPT